MSNGSMMTLGRNYIMATTKGHVIGFEKDVPIFVHCSVISDAIAIGAVMADGSAPDVLGAEVAVVQIDPIERTKQLNKAFATLLKRNKSTDFNAAGTPTPAAVAKLLDFEVDRTDMAKLWREFRTAQAERNIK